MKTSSSKNNIEISKDGIYSKLTGIDFEQLARETGFTERKAQKITPMDFLVGFFLMAFSGGANTLENWASKIAIIIRDTVSKQAVCKRIQKDPTKYLKEVLQQAINKHIFTKEDALLKNFETVYINDSTSLQLNGALSGAYAGNENMFSNVDKSILKIQTIYNVNERRFSSFDITSFRENDQKRASDILGIAKKGDLVIRDLGYFVLNVFKKMMDKGVYYISRLKSNVKIYCRKSRKTVDLLKLLRGRNYVDVDVLLGSEFYLPVRLIAVKLDEKTANERRRRARNNRDRRLNYSRQYYELLGWKILITNVGRDILSLSDIMKLYEIRFRIEVIFRCWKSYFKIADVKSYKNKLRMETYIYCMLIFIVLYQDNYLRYLESQSPESRNISLQKYSKFIADNILLMILIEVLDNTLTKHLRNLINYYCSYPSRKDRLNFNEKITKLG